MSPTLLSDEKYGRQHEHCKQHCHETEYELFLKPHHREFRAGRLDRKSSRGMIYENEELRLRTININAEIERGQYDIKKLKKENELLKKEIWCLRDEYEKLDKLLKEKNIDFSSSSTTSESDTCSSCPDDSDDVENTQNLENDQRSNARALSRGFAALSVVPEESAENSDRASDATDVIQADQSYPRYEQTARTPSEAYRDVDDDEEEADAILPCGLYETSDAANFYQNIVLVPESETRRKGGVDVLAKTDNKEFATVPEEGEDGYRRSLGANCGRSSFSNGGNLEELLNDIETISQDILAISGATSRRCKSDCERTAERTEKPFKSELNVTLMPRPMALIGLEKYREIQRSMNATPSKSMENLTGHVFQENQIIEKKDFHHFQQSSTDVSDFTPIQLSNHNSTDYLPQKTTPNLPSYLANLKDNYVSGDYFARYNPENFPPTEKPKAPPKILVKQASGDLQDSSENDENAKIKQDNKEQDKTAEETAKKEEKQKIGLRKKVSIHFRGKKEKQKKTLEIPNTIKIHSPVRDKKSAEETKGKISHQKTSSKDSNKTTSESDTKNNMDSRKTVEKSDKPRKSVSVSPDRRKAKEEKKCKKHKKDRMRLRRATVTSLDSHRARSHSVNTERSNTYGGSHFFYEDYLNSDRDSMSSSETLKTRQMNFSSVPITGKVPWCGCWGNGCI